MRHDPGKKNPQLALLVITSSSTYSEPNGAPIGKAELWFGGSQSHYKLEYKRVDMKLRHSSLKSRTI